MLLYAFRPMSSARVATAKMPTKICRTFFMRAWYCGAAISRTTSAQQIGSA